MGEREFSENTYSIHHFNASWFTDRQRKIVEKNKKINRIFGSFLGSKLILLFLAWDEVRYSGLKSLINKLLNKEYK